MVRRATLFAASLMLAACTAGPVREVSEIPEASVIPPGVAQAGSQRAPLPGTNPRPRGDQAGSRVITPPMIDELYLGGGKPIDAKGAQPARGPKSVGDITLDLKDADIQEVARVILGDLMKANYVIDPDVSGAITLQTGKPINRTALLPALEAALEGRGARVVTFGNIYRVTKNPGVSAIAAGGITVGPKTIPDGAGLKIFPLEYINAEEMTKILQPMLPEGSIVATDPERNLVMVAATGPMLALASGTVNIFDVDQMAGQTVLLTSLEYVDAQTMVAELEGVFASGGKGGPRGPVKFMAIDRLNAVMVISRQVRYIEEARHWIYRLDRTRSANENRLFVYYVQNGRAGDLAKTLRSIFAEGNAVEASASSEGGQSRTIRRPNVVRTEGDYPRTPTTNSPQPTQGRPSQAAAGQASSATPSTPSTALLPNQSNAGESSLLARNQQANAAPGGGTTGAGGAAPGRLSAGVRITADDKNNALLIAATPKDFDLIQDVLDKLDLVPLQVLVEATIFEVTLRDQLKYGLQYLISNGGLGFAK
ncbi:MAG: hypothetical protein IT562_06370, partial [Alphaproteobacteria bacterium]|nr:hypothetical protein [Alphaproteobacteria bacterium]